MSLSLYAQHVRRWSNCTLCPLHSTRTRIVLARGSLPCDVLLVGEAPGESEDVIGQPFVGPAGKFLDAMLHDASLDRFRRAYTNVVACIPKGDDGVKTAEPDEQHVAACSDRLVELVGIAAPRLIVAVGKTAAEYLTPGFRHSIKLPVQVPIVGITHPAAILRARVDQQGYARQRTVIALRDAVELLNGEGGG